MELVLCGHVSEYVDLELSQASRMSFILSGKIDFQYSQLAEGHSALVALTYYSLITTDSISTVGELRFQIVATEADD